MEPSTIAKIKKIIDLFAGLDKDTQRAVVAELPHLIDMTEKLGINLIDASQEVIDNAITSIEQYLTTLTKNRTDRIKHNADKEAEVETVRILVDGKIVEIKYDFLTKICNSCIETGRPDVAIQLLKEQSDRDIREIETKQAGERESRQQLYTFIDEQINKFLDIYSPTHRIVKFFDRKNSVKMLQDAFELNNSLQQKYPPKDNPQLAAVYSLLGKSVKLGDAQVVRMAIEIAKEEVEKLRSELPS